MKNTRKISIALVIAMVLMMALAVIPASAADQQPATLYLTPNANWKTDNARFAAYFFGNGETWISMADSNGDGVYEVAVPTDKVYPSVIFCRMNPNAAANNWNNKWNQTADLKIPTSGANHYTVAEGTWDKGAGTWSTFGSTCPHANLGAEATCTTSQDCLDCGDPVVSALGHTFNAAHLCTRCNEQASFTVVGSGAHLGTEWDTGNTANDMTYADGVYTKVYTDVKAGSYLFKVARDHEWGTAYPSADKAYTVAVDGSTVTITLKGTTVDVVVEAPHVHSWSNATCTEPQKCECGESQGDALGHDFVEGVCSRCEEIDPDYVAPEEPKEGYYVFEASDLEAATEAGAFTDGQIVLAGTDNYFTLIMSAKTKIDSSSKTWADGYTSGQRLNLGGATAWGTSAGTVTKQGIMFTTKAAAEITIWWVCGGDGDRYIAILDVNGNEIAASAPGVKNEPYMNTFTIPAGGTYYISNPVNNNYIFKVAVQEEEAAAHEHTWADATCEAPKTCTSCGETEGDALGHTYSYTYCLTCYAPNPYYIANTLVAGENKVICNEYHLVGDGQNGNHSFPYEFVLLTVTEDGTYTITGTMVGVTIFTTEVNTEGADFSTNGTSWLVYDIDGTADLKAGTYYIGLIYIAGQGEYTVNVDKAPEHEHNFVEGKCECGEEDPTYVPPHEHEFVEGKCECGAEDPDYTAPVEPDDQPDETPVEPELNFFQKLLKAIMEFIQKLLASFKK